jgi:hypothetical protein
MASESSHGLVPTLQQASTSLSAEIVSQADGGLPGQGQTELKADAEWLNLIQHHSYLVMGVVEVSTAMTEKVLNQRIVFANDYFCRLTGSAARGEYLNTCLLSRLSLEDQHTFRERFRRHCLSAVLQYRYGADDLVANRVLNEPFMVSLVDPTTAQMRKIELCLRTNRSDRSGTGIEIFDITPELDQALTACWEGSPSRQQVMTELLTQGSPLGRLLAQLSPENYAARGFALIEGVDVTEREISKALVQLLVSRESVLEPSKFNKAHGLMKQLFDADGSLLLSAESSEAKLFRGLDQPEWEVTTYAVEALQDSVFVQATSGGDVLNIPDLTLVNTTQCEQDILDGGVRSLLLIPLVMRSTTLADSTAQMIGIIGLTSNRPYAFDQADCSNATTLIPALTAAMRHTIQDRFTNIHPSVRWRFEQEAERRSWGLPPSPILFENVYPLYGISDIRGSSEERNRAIQQDLLQQFHLALAVVEAVCTDVNNALVHQMKLDLEDYIAHLHQGISVDSEVTLLSYLSEQIEAHFPCFAQHSPAAALAIEQYQNALHSEHQCVYSARAVYDQTITHINQLLRQTWNQWQTSMQAITHHYCDIEATDGIDHMIYAGKAIDPEFTDFQLRSLRYEQLRAMCDCARQSFTLKEKYDTDMVITHLVLVQAFTVDIMHDENTERLFDVRGTRDTRYEIVKKRIDKACDAETGDRITQPGMLTIVYSTNDEWQEYRQYLRYLQREGIVGEALEQGLVEPLQGVSGLKFARVEVLPNPER